MLNFIMVDIVNFIKVFISLARKALLIIDPFIEEAPIMHIIMA